MKTLFNKPNLTLITILALLSLVTLGCGGGSGGRDLLAKANKTNLDRICTLYFQYQLGNQGAGPADEATFRSFISGRPGRQLELIGMDPNNIDDVFLSDRDGEGFEILWGVKGGERDPQVAIVAEKTGVDGMRMIGYNKKPHREVDDAEYQRLFDK